MTGGCVADAALQASAIAAVNVARIIATAHIILSLRCGEQTRQNPAHMKTKTSLTRNSMNRSPLRMFLLIPFALACFTLSPQARADCQEGCDTNNNTFLGDDALISNTTGVDSTAIGFDALFSNTTGSANTATGFEALENNTTGNDNTADGGNALFSNTTGGSNTASGVGALNFNTTGFFNTAIGDGALFNNTTGSGNIALGLSAGVNLTTGNNNIDIGNEGVAGEAKHIRVGTKGTHTHTFIAGISGATVAGGVGVIIDTNGHLGTVVSSERFKDEVKPMDKASEVIRALRPVTFRYKHELDPAGIPQFGLVAEDVEKVNPDLVARDDQGKPYSVRYEAVNAMLLNEFLKEHRKVEQLEKQVEALTAGLQKVSAQLEVNKPASQTVLNNH
ncbi:MAG: hypothetical protein DME59_12745 [Verrucomicrobia bacterium]|nr:MAG: hypothetical protein DME59_12745 [Verrucomicrobiota bacterium]